MGHLIDNNFIKEQSFKDSSNNDPWKDDTSNNDPWKYDTPKQSAQSTTPEWINKFPCIVNQKEIFKFGTNEGYNIAVYTSKTEGFGIITLFDDGVFNAKNSTTFPKGGKWSCSKTNKIFLEDFNDNTKSNTTQDATQTTTTQNTTQTTVNSDIAKPKMSWTEVSIVPQDVSNGNQLVKYGMMGEIVSTIQQYLLNKGYKDISKSGKPDTKFGKRTYNSVKSFQQANGLKADGIVGKDTWAALIKSNDTETNTTDNTKIPDISNLNVSPDYNPEFQKENYMNNLKSIIKENLIETKVDKTKKLQESKIVKTRMNFIVESNKTDLDSALLNILFEMFYLDNQGFNGDIIQENVDDVFGALGSIFGNKHNQVSERFKEIGVNFILSKLDITSDTGLGDFLKVALSNTDIKDVPKLFSDCDFLTNKISNAIPEAYLNQLKYDEGMGSEFMEKVKSSLADVIKESDFSDKIKDRVRGIICPLVDNMQEKFGNHLSTMKSKLTSSTQA